jgi:transcriptional regulator with XRE-family HTH domain
MLNRGKVRKKMEEQNISHQALADKVGVSQPMITQILTGRKVPSLVLAVDIARALGCTVDELIESEVG